MATLGTNVQSASQEIKALTHAREAAPAGARRGRGASVVADLETQAARRPPEVDGGVGARAGVLDHVGQRLLRHPVCRELARAPQVDRPALLAELDGSARRSYPIDQGAQIGERRLRRPPFQGDIVRAAEDPQQTPHLRKRLTAGCRNRAEYRDGDGRITAEGNSLRALALPPRLARMIVDSHRLGAGEEAADIAAVLTERGLGGDSVDLGARLDQFRRDRSQRAGSARSLAQRWASQVAATEGLPSPSPLVGEG